MAEVSNTPVSFADWNTGLAGEQTLDTGARERYRRSIVAFLRYLKTRRERASFATAYPMQPDPADIFKKYSLQAPDKIYTIEANKDRHGTPAAAATRTRNPDMKKSHTIHLPRDPFAYIGLWQMLTFVMLLLLIWVNELRDISGFYFGESPDDSTLVRGCVLTAAVLFTAIVAVGNTYVQQKRILSTLISVCAKCHRVRINDTSWQLIEDYISDNSLLSFSHGLCPDCMAETMQDITSLKTESEPDAPAPGRAEAEPRQRKAGPDQAPTKPA